MANQKQQPEEVACTFRVSGKQPEFWHPDTGVIEKAVIYSQQQGRTIVPIRLEPAESVFVVFRKPVDGADPIISLALNGRSILPGDAPAEPLPSAQLLSTTSPNPSVMCWKSGTLEMRTASGKTKKIQIPALPQPLTLEGSWNVKFPPNWGAPEAITMEKLESWTANSNPGIKYFSGTATYEKEVTLPAGLFQPGHALFLDLGAVRDIPEVRLNGTKLGVLWKPPYRVDISGVAKPGKNRLEIKVTNMWPNRLIGDMQLSEAQRVTWTTYPLKDKDAPLNKETPLVDSGLLGPVRLHSTAKP